MVQETNIITTNYQKQHPNLDYIVNLNKGLGIDLMAQLARRNLQLFVEENNLADAGFDYYKRNAKLHIDALSAWQAMVIAADRDNVQLFICSAFRSYEYQANLIKKKLDKGLDINHITTILAPPGLSEHHTGRAIDIISTEIIELSQDFENTRAYAWLMQHASKYNFKMSYPKDNPFGIIYEPWHWCYQVRA